VSEPESLPLKGPVTGSPPMSEGHSCCTPTFAGTTPAPVVETAEGRGRHVVEQLSLPGGMFTMGDSYGDGRLIDGERLRHVVEVGPISIDATTVTNVDFAAFVDDTGYRTEAEQYGYSAVFHLAAEMDPEDVTGAPPQTPWWFGVRDADWRHPRGRHSSTDGLEDHPVVHVSWTDAHAYCNWAGRRLPTEAEWEYSSRGGLNDARFPWGDKLLGEDGAWRCNIWQGTFPTVNTEEDGWLTTAPVRSFEPNGYGLWQTVGNVWEWCADWFDANYYARSPKRSPTGPLRGGSRVMRGGSFLCHDSYCNRYRNSARSANTPDSSSANTGFRTVGK
jgi:sulfatase modifying factor 1